jgi:multidrug efflux pump subunit AcrA (membrane-fusion protein)
MRNLIIAGMLMSGMVASSPLLAQTSSDEVAQLKQRVAQLEKQVQEMSRIIEPLKAQQAAEGRRKAFRDRFEKKMAQDQAKYTREQLREAEQLMRVADEKWGSPEANGSCQIILKKYPDSNRAGCAMLYVAQTSQGDERAKLLQECIEKYNDCFYGDGVQVGGYARLLLAEDYMSKGEEKKAAAVYSEIKTKCVDAIDHRGNLLVDNIQAESK